LNTLADQGVGSPDLTRLKKQWHMVFQRRAAENPDQAQLWHTTSGNLIDWTAPHLFVDPEAVLPPQPSCPPPSPLDIEVPDPLSLIDGALAHEPRARKEGAYVLGFKWRCRQTFHVTNATSLEPVEDPDNPAVPPTPPWRQAERALAGTDDPNDLILGFAENYQFLKIDNVWRMIATARDPEVMIGLSGALEGRCGDPFGPNGVFYIYQCSHEPFLYTLTGDGQQLTDWTSWRRKTRLRIPYEDWNTIMHANSAFLADWRAYDGFFYLFYAGATRDQTDPTGLGFEFRGHGKIGVVRSRDLIHWRLPGDLRD
jgi:hypothetical protein